VNRAIRRVGIAVSVLILVLVAQLTYLQVVDADNLKHNPLNVRAALADYNRPRGQIITADGVVVAESTPTTGGDFKFQRSYPLPDLFAQITGYQSFTVGNTGVEASYDDVLTGRDAGLRFSDLEGIFTGKNDTGNVVLSISRSGQQAAADALGGQRGAIVAVDTHTGEIVAMFSNPTYNPNLMASHDQAVVQATFNEINSGIKPALARTYSEIFPPGSSFKIVTSAGALDTGLATPLAPFYPVVQSIPLPGTTDRLSNFANELCGGNLTESLVHSCNTTFGQVGLDLGNAFVPAINNCGVGVGAPPLDIPGAVGSTGPAPGSFNANPSFFAKDAIGQQDVAVTPLEMALAAAGIANGGVIMAPHVVHEIQDADGKTVKTIENKPWLPTCITPQNALALTDMMVAVVQRGTGTGAQIPGVSVAGKTGTAQSTPGTAPHAWFVAFAPAEQPRYAVAVIVEHGGTNGGDDATGGAIAAPIAKQVLQALLGV
jgi:peptidoglycan glycosyltransferase